MNKFTYLLLLVVAVYALTSVALALANADKCGQLNAQKHWIIVPPHWECGA